MRLFAIFLFFALLTNVTFAVERNPMASEDQSLNPQSQASGGMDEESTVVIEDIEKVRTGVDSLIGTDTGLSGELRQQMENLKRIREQADFHRRIVTGMKTAEAGEVTPLEQVVQQQKIRLIAEQTRKNLEIINQMRQQRRGE